MKQININNLITKNINIKNTIPKVLSISSEQNINNKIKYLTINYLLQNQPLMIIFFPIKF